MPETDEITDLRRYLQEAREALLWKLEGEGRFRDEVLRWMPGYLDEPDEGRRSLPVG